MKNSYSSLSTAITFLALILVNACALSVARGQVSVSTQSLELSYDARHGGSWLGAVNSLPACGEAVSLLDQPGIRPVRAETGAQPGEVDPLAVPAGRYRLFPDDGVLLYSPIGAHLGATYYTTDTDAHLRLGSPQLLATQAWDPNGWGPAEVYATSGRIVTVGKDDVVTATRSGNPADGTSTVQVSFLGEGVSATLSKPLIARQADSPDFIAITHSDLDHAVDANGNLHDEVIVAHPYRVDDVDGAFNHVYRFSLDVLNYGSGEVSSPEVTSLDFSNYGPIFPAGGNPVRNATRGNMLSGDNMLSVVTGDFLGDGHSEIAVLIVNSHFDGTLTGHNSLEILTFRYDTVAGHHTLTELNNFVTRLTPGVDGVWKNQPTVATIAAVAADLDGDGADELAVVYAKYGNSITTKGYNSYGVGRMLLKYDSNLVPVLRYSAIDTAGGLDAANEQYTLRTRPRVALVAGQFQLSTPSVPLGRKQLAMAWFDTNNTAGINNHPNPRVFLRAFSASTDLKTLTPLGGVYGYGPLDASSVSTITRLFSLASGGYEGIHGPNGPTQSIAVSDWTGSDLYSVNSSRYLVRTLFLTGAGFAGATDARANIGLGIDYSARMPLISYDRPGNSAYLGAPVHMTIHDAPVTSFLMQEPPKQVYWDEKTHAVVNLTRFDGNNVHLFSGTSASMSTTSTDHTSRDTGGSTSISAGFTVQSGADFGMIKGSAEASLDVQAKSSYDYSENKERYNSQYRQRTIESSGQTDRDDFLKGEMQTTDLWRYRVYGTPTGDATNAYYEMVMPGPRVPFVGGGLNFSWYQPRHENGNILSYPARLGATDPYIPSDAGSYTLANGSVKSQTPQIYAQLSFFDGTGVSTALKYSSEVSEGKSFSYSHEIRESLDIKTSYTASASTPYGGASFRVCGSIEAHSSNSWGGAETSTETTRDETAVTLNRAAGTSTATYPFYPVVYNTQDGTMKMSFAVPNPANSISNPVGYSIYANQYGGLPDPAVNLPLRFLSKSAGSGELELWEPNQNGNRKAMRGLFFRKPSIDPASGTYLLLAFSPNDGDVVRIEPRIYNFSTAQPAIDTVVQYQVIPYDSSLNSEVCDDPINKKGGVTTGLICPRKDRTTIATKTLPRLNPLQSTCVSGFDDPASTSCALSAAVNWNTKGYGPDFGSTEYRVYVVIDPDGTKGSEIYGIEPEPIAIANVTNATPMVVTAPGNTLETGDYVTIGGVRGLDRANGIFQVTLVSNDEFSLNGTVLSRGSYEGSGTAAPLDPGQNNEGYGTIAISDEGRSDAAASQQGSRPLDYLISDSFEGLSEQNIPALMRSRLTAAQNLPMDLRFTVRSTSVHTDAAQVLLFDGDPSTGAPAIASQVIHPGLHAEDGTSVWFSWTPATLGTHQLYAVLLDGEQRHQQAEELDVSVVARQK
jgi:hypothetical protein